MRSHTFYTYTFDEHPHKQHVLEAIRTDGTRWYDGEEHVATVKAFCERFRLERLRYEVSPQCYSWAKAQTTWWEVENLSGESLKDHLVSTLSQDGLLDGDCPFTGVFCDESILDPIREFIANPDERDYSALMNDCLAAWVKCWVEEEAAFYADENLGEFLENNEFEFRESGEIFNEA